MQTGQTQALAKIVKIQKRQWLGRTPLVNTARIHFLLPCSVTQVCEVGYAAGRSKIWTAHKR